MKAKRVDWTVHYVVTANDMPVQGIDPVELLNQNTQIQRTILVDVSHLIFAGSDLCNLMSSETRNCDLYKTT